MTLADQCRERLGDYEKDLESVTELLYQKMHLVSRMHSELLHLGHNFDFHKALENFEFKREKSLPESIKDNAALLEALCECVEAIEYYALIHDSVAELRIVDNKPARSILVKLRGVLSSPGGAGG